MNQIHVTRQIGSFTYTVEQRSVDQQIYVRCQSPVTLPNGQTTMTTDSTKLFGDIETAQSYLGEILAGKQEDIDND